MVWYLVPSRDPKLVVAVGWEPVLGALSAGSRVSPPGCWWSGSSNGGLVWQPPG